MDSETTAARTRRVRREPEVARNLILDKTETLMLQEGYAAVSTRRVAKEAGINPALVHYYFPTTDDLFVALHARMTERQIEQFRSNLSSDDPLRSLWQYQSNWEQASLGVEFIALANHRKAIRKDIAFRTEQARALHAEILRAMNPYPLDPAICSPDCLTTLIVGVARILVNEESIGITRGHAEVRAFVEWALDRLVGREQGAN